MIKPLKERRAKAKKTEICPPLTHCTISGSMVEKEIESDEGATKADSGNILASGEFHVMSAQISSPHRRLREPHETA